MKRSKKFIIIAVLATVLVSGSIGGAMVLADDSGSAGATENQTGAALWDRVTGILQDNGVEISSEQLKSAFTQAGKELRSEALQARLQHLVEQGKLTQEQADDYLSWQNARPDMPAGTGLMGPGRFRTGGMRGFGGPLFWRR